MWPAPSQPYGGSDEDSQTRPVYPVDDDTLTRVRPPEVEDETTLHETQRLRHRLQPVVTEEKGFVLPPPMPPPQRRRAPRTAAEKPVLRPIMRGGRRTLDERPPSSPSVPPPPSQPVMWHAADPGDPFSDGIPAGPTSSGVRASRAPDQRASSAREQAPNTEARRSRSAPPPPPSRASRRSPASAPARPSSSPLPRASRPTDLVTLPHVEPKAETAAVHAVEAALPTPPRIAPLPIPETALPRVQIRSTMQERPVAAPSALSWEQPATPAPMERWAPTFAPTPLAARPRFAESFAHAAPAIACVVGLALALGLAFAVFLRSTPAAMPVDIGVARAGRAASLEALDASSARRPVDETPKASTPLAREPRAKPPAPKPEVSTPAAKKVSGSKKTASPEKAPPKQASKAPPAKEEKEEAAEPQPAGTGTLNINSLPSAKAILDGRPLGNTPIVGVAVDAGVHSVTFVHPEFGKASVSVRVAPGKSAVASHRFPFRD